MKDVSFLHHMPQLDVMLSSLKTKKPFSKIIVICDRKLKKLSCLKSWTKDKRTDFYFIPSGEKTKSLEQFPIHLKKILQLSEGAQPLLFVGMGGGSVGDFVGFFSSVYKRGVPFVYFPTTWLAALDSAHGGKNALNFLSIKNVIGTYWFPKRVFVVEDFLKNLPERRKKEAFGELFKMALIWGGSFYSQLKKEACLNQLNWNLFLKKGIYAKKKWVKKDMYETKGLRRQLNLGHTLGHILESVYSLSHGESVLKGILFSAEWSFHKKFLKEKDFNDIKKVISVFSLPYKKKQISLKSFKTKLKQDKKRKGKADMDFVFIRAPGKVFVKTVSEKDICKEAVRQSWLR